MFNRLVNNIEFVDVYLIETDILTVLLSKDTWKCGKLKTEKHLTFI